MKELREALGDPAIQQAAGVVVFGVILLGLMAYEFFSYPM